MYKCIGERLIKDKTEKEIYNKLTSQELCNYQSVNGYGELNEDDVEILFFEINSGFGKKNPFDYIKFYHNTAEGLSLLI